MEGMTENNFKPEANLSDDESTQIDQDAIIDYIWTKLGGTVSRSDIREELIDVAPKYENARIKAFIPIFLTRDVTRRLLASYGN